MKYLLVIVMGLLSISISIPIYAQTKTASLSASPIVTNVATPTAVLVEKEIQNLKDRIATKVAELRKKNTKAITGVVTDRAGATINMENNDGDQYKVQVDDTLTKLYLISGSTKKEIKLDYIKKGVYLIVTGPIIENNINANFIYQDEQYIALSGKVTEVNSEEESIKVFTTEKENFTFDIEETTKMQLLDPKTLELETIRISKVKEGDTLHFVTKKTGAEKEKNRYTPQRILIIPQEYFIK
ncbi:hypothetical protein HY358_01010 [Candidatus Roizmanbacteria bacterium]|nr:hypothetical protein [Candidatus Roizmanbacteria bacterium]